VRASAIPKYGLLSSAIANGRDALDFGLEVPPGGLSSLVLLYSSQTTVVDGRITPGVTVGPQGTCYAVVYSRDRSYWQAGSRRVEAAQPDERGRFTIRGLPAGDYYGSAFAGREPTAWSDREFLSRLKPEVALNLVKGRITSIQLPCQ
jgi:hypothetical protein